MMHSTITGRTLGPYRLLDKLGEGGMGLVYRARDLRLDRPVAIKLLNQEYTDRFAREALAISSLNHPHICTLYDVGEDQGTPYLVMELVDGRPLTCPMPAADALRYAVQIADALAAAHRAGVVHRDLKPANVLIGKSGVKLLDFGVAKVRDRPAADAETVAESRTQQGVLIGTLPYMAPEQVQGLTVDARTDVFAFGLLLYELLTGQRAFQGRTSAELISSILRDPAPSVLSAAPDVPPLIDGIVQKCLEKDPEARWQTMESLRSVLEWAHQPQPHALPSRPGRPPLRWIGALAAVAVLAAGAGWMVAAGSPVPAAGERLLSELDFPSAAAANFDTNLALSPNGEWLVFNARGGLWLRSMRDGGLRMLPATQDGSMPFWSPDGRAVGFFAEGRLKRMDLPNGTPRVLAEAPNPRGGAWGSGDIILFAPSGAGPLVSVPAAGGPITVVTDLDPDREEDAHRAPSFLPDGQRFLFYAQSRRLTLNTVKVAALADGPARGRPVGDGVFGSGAGFVGGAERGHLLFLRDHDLVVQRFDSTSAQLAGDAAILATRVRDLDGVPSFSASRSGALVYHARAAVRNQPMWVGRDGRPLGTVGELADYQAIRLTSDAARLSVTRRLEDGGTPSIWIHDLERGGDWKLPLDGPADTGAWAPDGRLAVGWREKDQMHSNVYVVDPGSSGAPQAIAPAGVVRWPLDWSRDGRFLLYAEVNPVSKFDIWAASMMPGGERFPVVRGPGKENEARFSPDGRFIAYQTEEQTETRVYVVPFPAEGGRRLLVSEGPGAEPRWRGDGRELYYISSDRSLMAVPLTIKGSVVIPGRPVRLFGGRASDMPVWHFEPSHAGDRFLVLTLGEAYDTTPTHLLTGWQSTLR